MKRADLPRLLSEETMFALRDFVNEVLHGDDKHREWLLRAVDNYINDLPVKLQNEENTNDRE